MGIFFDDSRPDRRKRANRNVGAVERSRQLVSSPIPKAQAYELLTDHEIMFGGDRTFICDTESYINYWLAAFQCLETGKVVLFEDSPNSKVDAAKLAFMLHRFKIITFNGDVYDLPMLMLAMQGVAAWKLNEISREIIGSEMRIRDVEQKFHVRRPLINHIDLIEVAPIQASLKTYAGRLHTPRMQDLPYPFDAWLTEEQAANVRDYCVNDLVGTKLLYEHLKPHIELREQLGAEYGLDLRSKSDAQVAEAVLTLELEKAGVRISRPKVDAGATFKYEVPPFMRFQTPQFQQALEVVRNATFVIGNDGKADTPAEIKALKLRLGSGLYRMGNGGLHSSEKAQTYVSDNQYVLIDRDVTSYYPFIILTLGLYPPHLGPLFLRVYESIVHRRLKAKKEGNKTVAEGLKIAINGSFGKLGNKYSALYAPQLVTQTTVTGQLCLLMFIEMVELAGIQVVSANTDGIVIRCPRDREKDLELIVMEWEARTNFNTEETRYRSIHSRDVNNYIAVKEDGTCKTKGVYSEKGSALGSVLSKNPESLICSDAVQAFLAHGKPVAETIRECADVRRFVNVRSVTGGAEKDGTYLGKSIRWYYAEGEAGAIHRATNGDKIPQTDGARPLMILPDSLPPDLDYDHYVSKAVEILFEVGYYTRAKSAELF